MDLDDLILDDPMFADLKKDQPKPHECSVFGPLMEGKV